MTSGMKFLAAYVRWIDRFNDALGRAIAWLCPLMMLTALLVVVLRYGFDFGRVWMQELYVWMHGVIFMAGAAYTLKHDGHVRVDVFYAKRGSAFKAWVNLLGTVFLLLPLIAVVGWASAPYIIDSWGRYEGSGEAGGLPGVFLLKSVIWVFCALTGLQAFSMIFRSVLTLRGRDDLLPAAEDADG